MFWPKALWCRKWCVRRCTKGTAEDKQAKSALRKQVLCRFWMPASYARTSASVSSWIPCKAEAVGGATGVNEGKALLSTRSVLGAGALLELGSAEPVGLAGWCACTRGMAAGPDEPHTDEDEVEAGSSGSWTAITVFANTAPGW